MNDAQRRRLLFGGVAAAAGAAGLGASWWRQGGLAGAGASPVPADAAATGNPAPPARVQTLDGPLLRAGDLLGRPLIINAWAPWCGPCVKEMPELDRFAAAEAAKGPAGARVLGLAIDEEAAVRGFLAAHPVRFPVAVLGFAGLVEVRRLSNDPNVALPFTAHFDAQGRLQHRKFGATTAAELTGWVHQAS